MLTIRSSFLIAKSQVTLTYFLYIIVRMLDWWYVIDFVSTKIFCYTDFNTNDRKRKDKNNNKIVLVINLNWFGFYSIDEFCEYRVSLVVEMIISSKILIWNLIQSDCILNLEVKRSSQFFILFRTLKISWQSRLNSENDFK